MISAQTLAERDRLLAAEQRRRELADAYFLVVGDPERTHSILAETAARAGRIYFRRPRASVDQPQPRPGAAPCSRGER